MFKNYFKIAIRNFERDKGYTFINISGLAIGIACCIIILLYILTELDYDRYHTQADRIFRISSKLTLGGKTTPIATTNYPPAIAMRDDFPEVKNAVRFRRMRNVFINYQDKQFTEENIYYADNSVFEIFNFPMIDGNPETALNTAFSMVITEDIADKYFGDENPVGKIVKVKNQYDYKITGIIKSIPRNSHFTFDILCSFQTLHNIYKEQVNSWISGFSNFSYILLTEDADYKELEQKLPSMVEKYIGKDFASFGAAVEYFLQPLTAIHLHSHLRHEISENSDIMYIYIFSVIAFSILVIACINFMNLATARSSKRSKEIGMRKVIGGNRQQIMFQFLGESLIYSIIALCIAIMLVYFSLPYISSLIDRDLSSQVMNTPWLIPGFIGISIIVGLLAGSYPAMFLSCFHPITVLKGNIKLNPSTARFRQGLVVFQFAISIILIAGTGIIVKQLNFMKNKNLGFDKNHVIVLPIMENSIKQSIKTIKNELRSVPGVINVAISSHVPGQSSSGGSFAPEGFPEGQTIFMNFMSIDQDYLSLLDIDMIAGRNFSEENPADATESLLINEAAMREIGWDDPVGKRIASGSGESFKKIIGVTKDFHYKSAHRLIEPLFIINNPQYYRSIQIKINQDNIPGIIRTLENKWQTMDTNQPFNYYFLDETFDKQFRFEEKLRQIFFYFTLLAIFIACLGLFGLASFMVEQRTKEIGIRKVLGATIFNVLLLLSKEYVRWVIIAALIACPLAYFAMNQWLKNFAYHIHIESTLFLISIIISMIIALITVSFQSIKAAVANPVDSLKYE